MKCLFYRTDPFCFSTLSAFPCYKDIKSVMAAQNDLVEILARFDPKLVKMCPGGERPED